MQDLSSTKITDSSYDNCALTSATVARAVWTNVDATHSILEK